jgi:hypothetical protein
MLYDPRWNDTCTMQSLVAWLEIQPPDEIYDFVWVDGCMAAQYFAFRGEYDRYRSHSHRLDELIPGLADVAGRFPHTFGAALARARSLL